MFIMVTAAMINALRSGGFNLQLSDTNTILSFVMNMFNRFINSNEELRLDQGFRVYFEIFSYNHMMWPKSRRKKNLHQSLGCQQTETKLKIAGCVEIGKGFPGDEFAFKDKCLLTSLIVCNFLNEHYLNGREEFEKLKPLWTRNASKKSKVAAGQLLQEEITKVIECLRLPSEGPYDISKVLPNFCNYFSSQIHVIKSTQEPNANVESFPISEWDDTLKQIFLFQTEPGHVVPVINMKKYVNKNNQVCLVCKKTFTPFYRHVCSFKEKSCFRCNSYYAKVDTIIQENLPFAYCYSKLDPLLPAPVACSICNYKFPTHRCFLNHKTICGVKSERGRIGFFCDGCNKFIKGNSSVKTKREHQCPAASQKQCRHCKEIYQTEEYHQCLLKKESLTKIWPKLVFFSFEFKNSSSLHCTDCHKLRKDFQDAQGLNWKDSACKKELSAIKCSHHKNNTCFQTPNFCTVWKETKLGLFDEICFSDDDLNMNGKQPNIYEFNYDIHDKNPRKESISTRKKTEATFSDIKNIEEKAKKSVMDYFLLFLMSAEAKGCSFISLNSSNENMATVMDCILKIDWPPTLVKKCNTFVLIKTKCQSLLFLNASNYFKGNYMDLAKQFNLKEEHQFFPQK
jgi:hypothetical protein